MPKPLRSDENEEPVEPDISRLRRCVSHFSRRTKREERYETEYAAALVARMRAVINGEISNKVSNEDRRAVLHGAFERLRKQLPGVGSRKLPKEELLQLGGIEAGKAAREVNKVEYEEHLAEAFAGYHFAVMSVRKKYGLLEDDAAEVVHAAFIEFRKVVLRLIAAGRFVPTESMPLFLTVAFGVASNVIRKQQYRARHTSSLSARPSSRPDRDEDLGEDAAGAEETAFTFAGENPEELFELLEKLHDTELKTIAILKMQNYSTREISEKLCCRPWRVRRKLALIRKLLRPPSDKPPCGEKPSPGT